jgi:hypothetical protein
MNLGENLAKKIYKNKKTLVILAIVAFAAVGGAAYVKFVQHPSGTDTTTQTHSTATKQYTPTSGGGGSSSTATKNSAASTSSSAGTGAATLAAPAGQLLNKQTISLSSTDPQTDPDLESVCQTIPQASCDIDLTGPNNEVKTVGAQNTGSNGAVIFDWNAKTVGLTPGKWTVQAVVVQNNLTGTSHSEYLEVQP